MPITQLDPKTALVVIDLQRGIVSLPLIDPVGEVVEKSKALTSAFRRRNLPVVMVNVAGSAPGRTEQPRRNLSFSADWTELVPELEAQDDDLFVTKSCWGAFTNTGLEAELKERGVTQVVVTGVATAIGVEATARQAYELGFNVTLPVDAMTDSRAEAQEYSVKHVFPRIGEVGSVQDILDLLEAR